MTHVRAVPRVQIDEAAVRSLIGASRPTPLSIGIATSTHTWWCPTSGRLASKGRDGEVTTELVAGRSYSRPEGVEHEVHNANPFEFVFLAIEIKQRP
jgi:hypothetical protein